MSYYFRPGSGTRNQIPNIIPSASQCSYAACYCEENVYKICQAIRDSREGGQEELSKAWVVFVSNKKRVVPLWRQKAGKDEEKLVIWDYHAVLIYRPDHRCDIDVWPAASKYLLHVSFIRNILERWSMIWTLSSRSRHIFTNTWRRHSGLTPSSTPSTTGSSGLCPRRRSYNNSHQTGDTWEKVVDEYTNIHS